MQYINELKKYWLAACKSSEVKSKPHRVMVLNIPVVIVRLGGKLSAFIDACPHRNVPLSEGKIIGNLLECPYHGWQFDALGTCQKIPGLCDFNPHHSRDLKTVKTYESNNIIWIKFLPNEFTATPYLSDFSQDPHYHTYLLTSSGVGQLIHVVENFLDGTHTHFVHSGLIRSNHKRKSVNARIYTTTSGVTIHYLNEGKQSGIISKWFEPVRSLSIARFMMPSVAELEYQSSTGTNMVITVYFTPTDPNTIKAFILVSIKKRFIPNKIMELIITPFLSAAIKQDQKILQLQTKNINSIGKESFMNSEIDLIRPYLLRLLAGEKLANSRESAVKEVVIEL